MKFDIKHEGFVSNISLLSKSLEKESNGNAVPAMLSITPSLHSSDDDDSKEYGATIKVEIKNNIFDLELEHFFVIEFKENPTQEQKESEEMRALLINYLYPYSRSFIVSTLALAGYNTVNMPAFIAD